MKVGRVLSRGVAVLMAVASVSAIGLAVASAGDDPGSPARSRPAVLGPGAVTVTIGIRHSRFSISRLRVRQHTTVTFVVRNRDPIGHELIVGGPEVQAGHATGQHAQHGAVPGEVSVPPEETVTTSYEFHVPGPVVFACHLPGHFEYGMVGEVVVVPQR
jgi:uncharacterized cupredoxin-like copper-binding protein